MFPRDPSWQPAIRTSPFDHVGNIQGNTCPNKNVVNLTSWPPIRTSLVALVSRVNPTDSLTPAVQAVGSQLSQPRQAVVLFENSPFACRIPGKNGEMEGSTRTWGAKRTDADAAGMRLKLNRHRDLWSRQRFRVPARQKRALSNSSAGLYLSSGDVHVQSSLKM